MHNTFCILLYAEGGFFISAYTVFSLGILTISLAEICSLIKQFC
jgi:ABC-type anion transport system duplicated permease subunit